MPRARLLRDGLRAVGPALALGAAGLTVACADGPTAPAGPAASRGPTRAYSSVTTTTTSGGSTSTVTSSSSTSSTTPGDTARVTLNISPTTTATFTVNVHKVQIVAGSICDPRTSGYGPTLWDTPCTPATGTITVTAKAWKTPTGRPVVTFSPDLRFVPGKTNTIWLLDQTAAAQQSGVLAWCPTGSTTCVDESKSDPTLVTKYTSTGYAYRRIKHFSGYTVNF